MKSKWTLFAGIILLIAGIVIRKTSGFAPEGLLMIIMGVLLKTYYVVSKARSGEYKPGKELLFLFVGLGLFLGWSLFEVISRICLCSSDDHHRNCAEDHFYYPLHYQNKKKGNSMKKVIITGATGMVGKGILLECLDHQEVDEVLVIGRSTIGMKHPKA
jgi:hypothetical protein